MDSPFVSGVLRRFATDLGLDHRHASTAYRALVDRAHGACVDRSHHAVAYSPAILVTTQTIGGVAHVSVCDNGDALGQLEVRRLYASIRTGRTGAVQRALVAGGVDGAEAIVGRFGVALLAAFVIADRITITTRDHLAPPDGGIRHSCDSRSYRTEPYHVARPGTLVQLRIRGSHRELATPGAIEDALRDRASTLPVRINV